MKLNYRLYMHVYILRFDAANCFSLGGGGRVCELHHPLLSKRFARATRRNNSAVAYRKLSEVPCLF